MLTIDEYPALDDHWGAIKEVVDANEMTVEVIFMWVAGVCTLGGPLLLALAT